MLKDDLRAIGFAHLADSMDYRSSLLDLMPPAMGTLQPQPAYEVQAEFYMDGLKAQVTELEASLTPNQELVMNCWHGSEQLQVLSVSMPSKNVVALHCIDSEGDVAQITGHMHSITFSFRIITAKEPAKRRAIGFEMR